MSNTWVIFLRVRNNFGKPELIPHNILERQFQDQRGRKLPLEVELASYQLVGEVMAHQGSDG